MVPRWLKQAVVFPLVAGILAACGRAGSEVRDPVRIGTGPQAESRLLAAITMALLEEDGQSVVIEEFADSVSAREALELGRVDVMPGYTGVTWLEQGRADPPGSARVSWEEVREADLRAGLLWLEPQFTGNSPQDMPADASFAFVVRADAEITSMSQLATRLGLEPNALVCVDPEFGSRADGLRAVLDAYRVRYDREFVAADPEAAVLGVAAGDCLAGLTTATDGRAWDAGLVPLVDELDVFPSLTVGLVVRQAVRQQHPRLVTAVSPLVRQLTTERLGTWNARMVAGEELEVIARAAAFEVLVLEGRRSPSPLPELQGRAARAA